jgi:hypothetical protein
MIVLVWTLSSVPQWEILVPQWEISTTVTYITMLVKQYSRTSQKYNYLAPLILVKLMIVLVWTLSYVPQWECTSMKMYLNENVYPRDYPWAKLIPMRKCTHPANYEYITVPLFTGICLRFVNKYIWVHGCMFHLINGYVFTWVTSNARC